MKPERPFQRGDSATRPLPRCLSCQHGNCGACERVFRARNAGRHTRCRCACRMAS